MKNTNIVWFLKNAMLKGKLMNANQQKLVTKKSLLFMSRQAKTKIKNIFF